MAFGLLKKFENMCKSIISESKSNTKQKQIPNNETVIGPQEENHTENELSDFDDFEIDDEQLERIRKAMDGLVDKVSKSPENIE